jgi:hypothetical protein
MPRIGCIMSRQTASPDEAKHALPRELSDLLPSWLTSLVVHLSLVLLLAVVTVIGDGGWNETTVELNCETSGSEGLGDAMLAAVELPSELDSSQQEKPLPSDLASQEPQRLSSDIELVDPTGAIGAAAVDAGLAGDQGDADAGPVQTAVFGLAAEGQRFVYVFDRSKSMTSTLTLQSEGKTVFSITPLEAAKAELLRSLGDLDRGQQFHILFYNSEVWMFDPGGNPNHLVAATPRYKNRATEFVRSVYGNGGTRHVEPLEVALRMRPDVIFLLTDGEAKDDPTDAQLRRLRRLNGGRTKINVIQFCLTPRTGGALVRLAAENGGRHVFMNLRELAQGLADTSK